MWRSAFVDEVGEDALELVRRESGLDLLVDVGAEHDPAGLGLRLEESQRRGDERRDGHAPQLEREHAGVDPGQLEQVVDEHRERPHLLPQRRDVVLRGHEPVLDRLEQGLQRGDRRAKVVARPGHELSPGVEELLERFRHGVERDGELSDLRRAFDRRPSGKVAGGERPRGRADSPQRAGDRAREHQGREDGCGGRAGRDGEDLLVGSHVEHDPPRQQDGAERDADGNEGEPGELQRDRRCAAEEKGEDEP